MMKTSSITILLLEKRFILICYARFSVSGFRWTWEIAILCLRFQTAWPERTPRVLNIPMLFSKWKVSSGILNCRNRSCRSSDLEYLMAFEARLFNFGTYYPMAADGLFESFQAFQFLGCFEYPCGSWVQTRINDQEVWTLCFHVCWVLLVIIIIKRHI